MIKLLLAPFLALNILIALDFSKCFDKTKHSFYKIDSNFAIAVSSNRAILFSNHKPSNLNGFKIVKYNPFLNLYILETTKQLNPLTIKNPSNIPTNIELASINIHGFKKGAFISRQNGFDEFAKVNFSNQAGSAIEGICYQLYGVGIGGNSFIEASYIIEFLKNPNIEYGDLGFRFEQVGSNLILKHVDTTINHDNFKPFDKIVSIDGKNFGSLKSLNDYILYKKPNSTVSIVLNRVGEVIKTSSKIYKKEGGGVLSDTFLERYGAYFDKNLNVISLSKNSYFFKKGLKIGDKILEINRKKVSTHMDIKDIITNRDEKILRILIKRDDFTFFVTADL